MVLLLEIEKYKNILHRRVFESSFVPICLQQLLHTCLVYEEELKNAYW